MIDKIRGFVASVVTQLASPSWWRAAGMRAARTFLVMLSPFVGALVQDFAGTWVHAVDVAGLGVVVSLATSLVNLPELSGTARSWWVSMVDRALRTFGQAVVAGAAVAEALTGVEWPVVVQQGFVAAIGSVVLAMISALPEALPESVPASRVVQTVRSDGTIVAGPASPLPDGTPIGKVAPPST